MLDYLVSWLVIFALQVVIAVVRYQTTVVIANLPEVPVALPSRGVP
jgi:hypothetical protein